MPVHTTPRWAAERPRSASLPAYPAPAPRRGPESFAVDMVVAAAGRGATNPVFLSPHERRSLDPRHGRHQPAYPLPRAARAEPPAPRSFAALWAKAEDVCVARRRPAPAASMRLPHEPPRCAADVWPWPGGDLELVGGARRRYRLYRTADALRSFLPPEAPNADLGIRGANSIVSLVSVHDTGAQGEGLRGLALPTPVFYLVCKTFALQDVPARNGGPRPYLRATSLNAICREVDASMLPAATRTLDGELPAMTEPIFEDEAGWPAAARPGASLGQPEATAVEPGLLLRQLDAFGSFVHVLYPLSQFDGLHVLQVLARHAEDRPQQAGASRELFAHALMEGPLTSLSGMHQAGYYHQDLKPANLLWNIVPFPPDDPEDDQGPRPQAARDVAVGESSARRPQWLLKANLVDFGHATPNNVGSMATGSLHTHAPEAFIAAANYREADAALDWLPAGSYFERWQDDIWAFGLLLMRILTPSMAPPANRRGEWWLSCPLVPDYILDPQARDPASGAVVAGFVRTSLDANHRTAQLFLKAWRPVHAQWTDYYRRRRAGRAMPPPRGNRLPTPNGDRIDEALGLVASTGFNFLGPLLEMTKPLGSGHLRPPPSELINRYGDDITAKEASAGYRRLCQAGARELPGLFAGRFSPSSFAAQAEVFAAAATWSPPAAPRRHWAQTGSWPRREGRADRAVALAPPQAPTAHAADLAVFAAPTAGGRAKPPSGGEDLTAPATAALARSRRARGSFAYASYESESEGVEPSLEADCGSPNFSEGPPSTPEHRGQAAVHVGSAAGEKPSWSGEAPRVVRIRRKA